jgi:hypothetical protein
MKIFRNVRQKLAAENKVMAYLRYAVGEILLVMIGILLALQVNNWNESRKQNIAEKEFIEGVKKDLTQDKNYIEFILKKTKPKIEAYDLLSKIDFQNNSENKNFVDSLFQNYLSTEGARTFYPVSGSFQSALSGNMLNNYKNKEITSALIKLYNSTYSRLMDDNNILNTRWDYLRKKYIHEYRTGNFHVTDSSGISKIMDDIYYHYLMLKWYRGVLKDTLIEIDKLLQKTN